MTQLHTSHFTGTTKSREMKRLKRWVFRRLPENSHGWCGRDAVW